MDITRTFVGMCQVRNNEADPGDDQRGKWTMLSIEGCTETRPVLEQFDLGHVNGWIEYEFTATAVWDYDKMKYNQFKIDPVTVGLISVELRLADLDWVLKDSQGNEGEKNKSDFYSIIKKELIALLLAQEESDNFHKKYRTWVWSDLEPKGIT